ncbi:hypothetical protein Tph_c18400 [Thermacetogenium phaeum DSM 12270]|uniref:Uncharacterized protein n=1 Tax=Thermacetogenium phaeum (strain ATCC BAA-254 / DSM 26808 / PB) TaxID=1089553 RepID=K4LIZ2_THEPS|nr:hypothetical protein Tph_c18400 [Thermacetogenium phaeum DSM 12270]
MAGAVFGNTGVFEVGKVPDFWARVSAGDASIA